VTGGPDDATEQEGKVGPAPDVRHGMPMRSPRGVDLVRSFVDDCLNGHRRDAVETIFSPAYRDHHPLRVPVAGEEPAAGWAGTTRDVQVVIDFLAQDSVDIAFVLEDVFGTDDRVGYRLFGEGTLALAPSSGLLRPGGEPEASAPISGSGHLVGNRLHVEYLSIGIFKVAASRLAERWGPVELR
jgi:hypothetical protein